MKKVNNVFKQIFLVMCLVCIFREIVFAANESGGAEAVVGNGEFVSDPEIEKLINQKEADMEKYFQMKQARALSENMITENPENTPFATEGSPNLIREGGRTVGSGRVATIIE